MLPQEYRLPSNHIPVVLKTGQRISTATMTLFFLPGSSSVSRFAIIVNSRAIKKAHDRNRSKRLLRERLKNSKMVSQAHAFRFHGQTLSHIDAVILVRKKPEELSSIYINNVVDELFQKIILPASNAA